MVLNSDGSKFLAASADKSISIYDAGSGELIKHITGAHKMGIYDVAWTKDD